MSLFPPGVELGALKISILEIYYNVLEEESWLTLGLNVTENTNYIKKCFKQKFSPKNSMDIYLYLVQEWSWGTSKIAMFVILKCTEMGK